MNAINFVTSLENPSLPRRRIEGKPGDYRRDPMTVCCGSYTLAALEHARDDKVDAARTSKQICSFQFSITTFQFLQSRLSNRSQLTFALHQEPSACGSHLQKSRRLRPSRGLHAGPRRSVSRMR